MFEIKIVRFVVGENCLQATWNFYEFFSEFKKICWVALITVGVGAAFSNIFTYQHSFFFAFLVDIHKLMS